MGGAQRSVEERKYALRPRVVSETLHHEAMLLREFCQGSTDFRSVRPIYRGELSMSHPWWPKPSTVLVSRSDVMFARLLHSWRRPVRCLRHRVLRGIVIRGAIF